ncbi:hypothetical protein [Rubrivivax gelatinosus]|uniref:hypothetical protein n=1 Tax=Rubrivivax gelatinosus TaxID=28068 RepID=UPI0019030A3D|nr:hypothetical protein [Rubrivivax gelatinosus]
MKLITISALILCAIAYLEADASSDVLRLEGGFEYRSDEESRDILGDQVCFYPEGRSASLVPRDKADQRLVWFCFRNTADAKQMLQVPASPSTGACGIRGRAQVEVADYWVYRGEGDGNDLAILKVVISASSGEAIACQK